jgi:hypothetical protein
MSWQNYSPQKFQLSLNKVPLAAYADGTMITVTRDEPLTTKHVGTDGFGIFTEVADDSGGILIRLADYSPSNAVLSAIAFARVPVTALLTDVRSFSKVFSSAVMVGQLPDLGKGVGPTMNEWAMIFIKANILHLGQKPLVP